MTERHAPAVTAALERRELSGGELLDLVRGRLLRGFDRARLPLELENELGVPQAATQQALEQLAGEERAASRKRRARLAAFVVALSAGGVALNHFMGVSRALGLGLFAVMFLVMAAAAGWLIHSIRSL